MKRIKMLPFTMLGAFSLWMLLSFAGAQAPQLPEHTGWTGYKIPQNGRIVMRQEAPPLLLRIIIAPAYLTSLAFTTLAVLILGRGPVSHPVLLHILTLVFALLPFSIADFLFFKARKSRRDIPGA